MASHDDEAWSCGSGEKPGMRRHDIQHGGNGRSRRRSDPGPSTHTERAVQRSPHTRTRELMSDTEKEKERGMHRRRLRSHRARGVVRGRRRSSSNGGLRKVGRRCRGRILGRGQGIGGSWRWQREGLRQGNGGRGRRGTSRGSPKHLAMKCVSQRGGRLRYLRRLELATIAVAQAGIESLGGNLYTGQSDEQRKTSGEIPGQLVHGQPILRALERRAAEEGGGPG